jgi:integrase
MHNKLTRTFVKNVTKDGLYNDGGGLNLQVRGASKIWMFGYRDRVTGKKRSLSLGPDHTVDQERAREEAKKYRDLLREGKDPLTERNGVRLDQKIKAGLVKTVNEVVDEYWDMRIAHRSANRIESSKYTLRNHVRAKIGHMTIQKVDTNTILGDAGVGLRKLWTTKGTHTAAWHLRIHLEGIFRLAIANEYYHGRNPAEWKGHLEYILPASKDIHDPKRHTSLPYQDLPRFLAKLHDHQSNHHQQSYSASAYVLEWIARTGAREHEVCRMTFGEIDRPNKLWNLSWERRKNRRDVPKGEKHSRPIPPALERILDEMQRRRNDHSDNAPVFGRLYTNKTISGLLRSLWKEPVPNPDGSMSTVTVHGFRRTFTTWALAPGRGFTQREVDGQLDHKIPGQTRQAYDPGATAEERRPMMNAFNDFIDRPTPAAGANVTEFKRRRSA